MAEYRNVAGMSQLLPALKELAPTLQRRHMGKAVGAATQVVRDQAFQDAPVYHGDVSKGHPPPGTLKRAIQRKFLGTFGTRTQWIVFVRSGKKARDTRVVHRLQGPQMPGAAKQSMRFIQIENQDAYYWKMVNFGTSKMPANRFMSNALPKSATQAIDAMHHQLAHGLKDLLMSGKLGKEK